VVVEKFPLETGNSAIKIAIYKKKFEKVFINSTNNFEKISRKMITND
jgi:hypothetical protein